MQVSEQIVVQPLSRRVRKRDGKTMQGFDINKVVAAIRSAWDEVGGTDEAKLSVIAEAVAGMLPQEEIDVEAVQDSVEVALMHYKLFNVAKAYIIYRQKRAEARTTRQHPDPVAVSDYIHAAKYARYRKADKRREVYAETVTRSEEMHLRKYGHIPGMKEKIRWAFDLVRKKRLLPSMRSMQFGGIAVEKVNNRIYNCSATHLDRLEAFAEGFFLLLCGCGVGYSVQFEHIDKLPEFTTVDENKVRHHVVEDSIEGWADALKALLYSYVDGTYVEFAYYKVRPEGAILETSGGKAPGHLPLKRALRHIRAVLDGAQGRRLHPIEAHRIMCHAADAVLSGGIRRSAMIALFSLEDSEMMNAKTGKWMKSDPWFQNANNSVVLKRGEVKKHQFRRIFQMTRQWGEPGFLFVTDGDQVTNPCQPAWATVLTPDGVRTLGEIAEGSQIWSGKQWTKVTKKWSTGVKPVYAYKTRAGTFYGTENHRIICEGEKVEVGQADAIDTAQGPSKSDLPTDPQAVLDGLVFGDGSVHGASNDLVYLCVGKEDRSYLESEVRDLIGRHRPGITDHAWEIKTTIAASEIPMTYLRTVPTRFRFGSTVTVRSFLRGLYSANGSIVSTRVTLKAASFDVIRQAQEMLSSLGIASYYTTNGEHTVAFKNGDYVCRESYDLNITHGRNEFKRLIGFLQPDKQARLDAICDREIKSNRKKTTYEIVEQTLLGEEEVFDLTVEADEHTYWTGGLLVSNCGEIGLNARLKIDHEVMRILRERAKRGKPMPDVKLGEVRTGYAFCNLTELNGAMISSLEEFLEVAEAAALIGTLQAGYTEMAYLGWVSEVIAEREALLGIGITGMMDSPAITLNPEYQAEVATRLVEWNQEYADMIGIRHAARITCIKPSGTTSLELGSVGSGHHPHHARRYIRRITANELESVFQHFKSINPQMCVRKPNGDWSIEFTVEAPEGAIVKDDLNAIQFLEMVKSTQLNWVMTGTARPESSIGYTHNVSNTVQVKLDEWETVAEYLWENREHFSGVTLLAATGDKDYAFAPNEAVTTEADEVRWNQLLAHYKPVDYTALIEEEDATDVSQEPACAGGACEVVRS